MSRPHTSLIRTLQATTIFLPTITSGISLAASILLTPRLLESPTPLMLRQWQKMFAFTKILFPATLHPTAAALYFLAWHFRGWSTRSSRLYLVAGLLCSGVGPYTWLAVMPTNRRILAKVEETRNRPLLLEEEVEGVETMEGSPKWLVDHWGVVNLPRVVMMSLAGVLGLVAAL